jgi:hypothetical protein
MSRFTRKHYIIGGALLLLFLAIVAFIIASVFSKDMIEGRILRTLAEKNVPVKSMDIAAVGVGSVVLENLVLGNGDAVKARRITAHYVKGNALENLELDVDIEGLEISAQVQNGALVMGGVERLWQPQAPASGKPSADILLAGDAKLTGGMHRPVEGTITLTAGSYSTAEMQLNITNATITPAYDATSTAMVMPFTVAEVSYLKNNLLQFTPVSLQGTAVHVLHSDDVSLDASLQDPSKKLTLSVKGNHALSSNRGSLDIANKEAVFGSGALQFATLAPGIAADSSTPPMTLSHQSRLEYRAGALQVWRGTAAVNKLQPGGLIAKALGKDATLEGVADATVPFEITPQGWRIGGAAIQNEGLMVLKLISAGTSGALSTIAGALGETPQALDQINIDSLVLKALSTDSTGGMQVAGQIKGKNPIINRPVVLNINITTNIESLLKSLSSSTMNSLMPQGMEAVPTESVPDPISAPLM